MTNEERMAEIKKHVGLQSFRGDWVADVLWLISRVDELEAESAKAKIQVMAYGKEIAELQNEIAELQNEIVELQKEIRFY